MSTWSIVAAVVGGLVLLWAVLVGLLWVAARRTSQRVDLRDLLRLVPDVIPVVGYADDVVVVALVLRSVVRRAGPEAIERHWPGTDAGLAAVLRLAGVTSGAAS